MRKLYAPKPFEVRVKHKNFLALQAAYSQKLITGDFSLSGGKGSKAYYERSLARYASFLTAWSHLLEINLKQQKTNLIS